VQTPGVRPGSRRSERLRPREAAKPLVDRPPRRQARSSPASALRSLDLQGYLRETAVPLPEGLGNAVTPDMEYLIDRRLVLEEGRFAAKALRGGSRSEGARAPASPRDSMTMFMATLGTNPLLTREHEGRLMAMVSRWHELQRKARELQAALGREPTRAEWAAAAGLGPLELAQQEWCGQEARMLMAQYNMRLVLHIAKRYVNRGVELPDLVAEGMEGLLRAVDKFDHRRGVKFSTYSHWWVRQAITRAITNQSRVVRLPVHVWDLAHKILRVEQEITAARGLEGRPLPEEVAEAMGLPVERVSQVLKLARVPKSLDGPAYTESRIKKTEDDVSALVDTIAVYPEDPAVQEAKDEIIRQDVNALVRLRGLCSCPVGGRWQLAAALVAIMAFAGPGGRRI